MIARIKNRNPLRWVSTVELKHHDMEQTFLFDHVDDARKFYNSRLRKLRKEGLVMEKTEDFDHAHFSTCDTHFIYLFENEPVY